MSEDGVPLDVRRVIEVTVRLQLEELLGADPRLVGEFLRDELDRRRRRRDLVEQAKRSVIGSLVVVMFGWLSWLGWLVFEYVKHEMRRG